MFQPNWLVLRFKILKHNDQKVINRCSWCIFSSSYNNDNTNIHKFASSLETADW